jgi:hypothetical protein
MSEPSASTESAVVDNDQPSGPARTPGPRTPRRVQWAAAVDEDEDEGDYHGLDTVDEDDSDHHGLDQAGLDVCKFSLPFHFYSQFSFSTQPAAFRTLTHALEHHRSNSALPLLTRTGSVLFQHSRQPQSSTPSSAESTAPASPKRPSFGGINLPGEAFIEPHERAGLPVSRSEHEKEAGLSESELRAAHVVRAHSRKPFKFSKHLYRRRRSRATKERRDSEGIDREEAIDMSSPMTRMHGGGILAALLALYDHDRDSDMASVSDRMTDPYSSGTRTPDGIHSAAHSLLDLASTSGKRLATASKALHLPEPRPRRERNAAGVWGSLITSTTGTFVGATAPTHSTIAPDVKRPGYHVSRWVHCVFVL